MKSRIRVRREVARMRWQESPAEGRAGKLRLDFNENTLGCSPAARAAVRGLTREHLATYPAYESTLRRLACYFGVRPAELLLTNGGDDALRTVADTFLERGSRVLIVEPTFPMYRFYAQLAGARVVPLRYNHEMRFPLEKVLGALLTRPRVFFLANPNNPTGTLVPRPDLRRILRAAPGTVVVADEAYAEFSGVTVLPWIRRYPNLVVLRTFSKSAGLAALRLGCLFANRKLAAEMGKTQPPFGVNSAALVAAEAAVGDQAYLRRYVHEIGISRREFGVFLERLGIRTFPSAANFVLADFGERAPGVLRALRRRGILVRDRSAEFGRVGYVRITIGTRGQMRRLTETLRRAFD